MSSFANAQSPSTSVATSPSSTPQAVVVVDPNEEIRKTLSRALDKVESQAKLIDGLTQVVKDGETIIARQELEKKELEEVIVYKNRTIAAKDEALASERNTVSLLNERVKLGDERVNDLTGKLKSANKRTKWAFVLGVVTGFVGRGLLGGI